MSRRPLVVAAVLAISACSGSTPPPVVVPAAASPAATAAVEEFNVGAAERGRGAFIVERARPSGVLVGRDTSIFEVNLATLKVCVPHERDSAVPADTLVCVPCDEPALKDNPERTAAHADEMWTLRGHKPFLLGDRNAHCVRSLWQRALVQRPGDRELRSRVARFRLTSGESLERALAWASWDALVDTLLTAHDTLAAARVLADAGGAVWDRAELYLQRATPVELPLSDEERANREIGRNAPALLRLPALPPRPTGQLGETEARYAGALFRAAHALVPTNTLWQRMTLTPLVWLADWRSLDGMASQMLAGNPSDSVAWPARALARYHTDREGNAAMALFDSALRVLPKADSARYDNLDAVLSSADAEWRTHFVPADRLMLERRTWAVLDPLWTTPVNEVRLEAFARTADADLRYALSAGAGASGSATPLGTMLRRRGVPEARWHSPATGAASDRAARRLAGGWSRSWPGVGNIFASAGGVTRWWPLFHDRALSMERMNNGPPTSGDCIGEPGATSVYRCVVLKPADFRHVPFVVGKDTIDVHIARFRGASDSAGFYVAARVPTRAFPDRNGPAGTRDSVRIVNWIKSPDGVLLQRFDVRKAPPRGNEHFWYEQWTTSLGAPQFMHRVEALSVISRKAAMGWALATSEAPLPLSSSGFGMSDILVADAVRELRTPVRTWRDLAMVPNAAVVQPDKYMELVWEVYDLKPGPDGQVRWSYSITLRDAADMKRAAFSDLIAGRALDRRPASDSTAPIMKMNRTAPASSVSVDHFRLHVRETVPGRYVLRATITDEVAHTTVQRDVSVRILDDRTQRRGTLLPMVPAADGFVLPRRLAAAR